MGSLSHQPSSTHPTSSRRLCAHRAEAVLDSGWSKKKLCRENKTKTRVFFRKRPHHWQGNSGEIGALCEVFCGNLTFGVNGNPKSQDLADWTLRNLLLTTCWTKETLVPEISKVH